MKLNCLHWIGLMTAILALTGCGGGGSSGDTGSGGSGAPPPPPPPPTTYTVGVKVTGLTGPTTLQLNGGDNLTVSANGSATFSTALASGATYAVTVSGQPAVSPAEYCIVANGTGTMGNASVTLALNCGPALGGLWSGHGGLNNDDFVGFSDESGNYYFYDTNTNAGTEITAVYAGTATVTGTGALNVSTYAGVALAFDFTDGSLSETGSITSGTVMPRASIAANENFKTTGSTSAPGGTSGATSLSVVYQPTSTALSGYAESSSLSAIGGTYSGAAISLNTSVTMTLTIDPATGNITGSDNSASCAIAGKVSILDPHYNLYGVQLTYTGSTGSCAATLVSDGSPQSLNGVTLTGLATLDTTTNPSHPRLSIGASVTSAPGVYKYIVYYNALAKS